MSKIVQTQTNIKNHTRKALQRGFSNVQIAIGILVTVILLLGALSGYQYIQQAKVNNEVSALTDLKTYTVSLGQAQGNFPIDGGSGATATTAYGTATLVNLNFFQNSVFKTSKYGTTDASVLSQWNGKVEATSSAVDTLTFTFSAVPSSVCRDIIPKALKNIAVSIEVAGTKSTDLAALVTKCGNDTVEIAYDITSR